MRWRVSPGIGRLSAARTAKRLWLKSLLSRIRRLGEKHGSKRSLLVEGGGVPLSLAVSGAKWHDRVFLELLLKQRLMIESEDKGLERNLCLDAGYVGRESVVREQGIVAQISPRGEAKKQLEKDHVQGASLVCGGSPFLVQPFSQADAPLREKRINKVMTIYG